jgi:hypothetical protein
LLIALSKITPHERARNLTSDRLPAPGTPSGGQVGQSEAIVFPSPMDLARPQSNLAMLATLDRLGVRAQTTVHGLCRATFSTWAYHTAAARPEVIERCLAHGDAAKVKAAYNRAQFTDERRPLLAAWADYLAQPPARAVESIGCAWGQ